MREEIEATQITVAVVQDAKLTRQLSQSLCLILAFSCFK